MVEFEAARSAFDRVVSIEMFEHMKNYQVRRKRSAALCLIHHTVISSVQCAWHQLGASPLQGAQYLQDVEQHCLHACHMTPLK